MLCCEGLRKTWPKCQPSCVLCNGRVPSFSVQCTCSFKDCSMVLCICCREQLGPGTKEEELGSPSYHYSYWSSGRFSACPACTCVFSRVIGLGPQGMQFCQEHSMSPIELQATAAIKALQTSCVQGQAGEKGNCQLPFWTENQLTLSSRGRKGCCISVELWGIICGI